MNAPAVLAGPVSPRAAAPRIYLFRGRPCAVASAVGRVLGYARGGRALVEVIRKQWADELIPGRDVAVLTGADLAEFKALLGDAEDPSVSSTARLCILYESGIDLVCVLTQKPAGRKLRRYLADEVFPALRAGAVALPAGPAREPPALPPKPRAVPGWKLPALRNLETVDRVLDLVEKDLGVLAMLGRSMDVQTELHDVIHAGLTWTSYAIRGASYALDDPSIRARSDEVQERWRRLSASYRPL